MSLSTSYFDVALTVPAAWLVLDRSLENPADVLNAAQQAARDQPERIRRRHVGPPPSPDPALFRPQTSGALRGGRATNGATCVGTGPRLAGTRPLAGT